uniref:C2H2-type domain-containing protein n=1 Tax=Anopheles quadriannulatus TaxID=34691 RepID=A0A182X824_ANOQN
TASKTTAAAAASASSSAFKCPRCPRAYGLSYTLERHMKYECGVAKQFGCFKCGKRFSRKDILKAHISNTRLHCAAAAVAAASVAASAAPSNATTSVVATDDDDALAGMMLSAFNRHHHHDRSDSDEPIAMAAAAAAPSEMLLLSLSTSPSLVQQEQHQPEHPPSQQHSLSSSVAFDGGSSSLSSLSPKTASNCAVGGDRDRVLAEHPLKIRSIMSNLGGNMRKSDFISARNESCVTISARSSLAAAAAACNLPDSTAQVLLRHEREPRGSSRFVSSSSSSSSRITVATGLLLQSSTSLAAGNCGSGGGGAGTAQGKRFRCDYCTFSCSWRYDLKLHLKQKHGVHKKNV